MNTSRFVLLAGSILALAACGRMPDIPVLDASHPSSAEAAAAPVSTMSVLSKQPASPLPAAPETPAHQMQHEHGQHEAPSDKEMHHDH